jgi:uncharacterized protein YndB with AHSA1/START domain
VAALDINRSIDIKATVTKVWAALTEPELLMEWFGDLVEFDPSPGATGVVGWTAEKIGPFRMVVEQVDAPKTLVYRWAREAGVELTPENSTVVRFDVVEIDGGTRVTVQETGFETLRDPQAAHRGNAEGWPRELRQLADLVESL